MENMTKVRVTYQRENDLPNLNWTSVVSIPSYMIDNSMTQTIRTAVFNALTRNGKMPHNILYMERA